MDVWGMCWVPVGRLCQRIYLRPAGTAPPSPPRLHCRNINILVPAVRSSGPRFLHSKPFELDPGATETASTCMSALQATQSLGCPSEWLRRLRVRKCHAHTTAQLAICFDVAKCHNSFIVHFLRKESNFKHSCSSFTNSGVR